MRRDLVLLVAGLLITVGTSPALAGHGDDRFIATGTIAAGNPASPITGSAAELAWAVTDDESLTGTDGDLVDLPAWAGGHTIWINGTSEATYDLDATFYTDDGGFLGSSGCQTGQPHETCELPLAAGQVFVKLARGADVDYQVEVVSRPPSPIDGCAGLDEDDPNLLEPETGQDTARPVVAVIDTGTNPFHDRFQRPSLDAYGSSPVDAVDTRTGQQPLYVPIEDVDDRELAECTAEVLDPRTLYRFSGTNLLFYSVLGDVEATDPNGHGTATTGTVEANAPGATMVMVQTTGGTLAQAIDWAADQPWIDVLSISFGCPGNLPICGSATADATRDAVDAGKLVVVSSGNEPTPGHPDATNGPPHVISVGGMDPYRQGEAWIASKAPDVVSNFTVVAPTASSTDQTSPISGTSFSAPTIAGTLAQTIHVAREDTGHVGPISNGALVDASGVTLTNADLREALNRTSVYLDATDYGPAAQHPETTRNQAIAAGVPVTPGAPWIQTGWGYANGSLGAEMAHGLIDDALPSKPLPAQAWMTANEEARQQFWNG